MKTSTRVTRYELQFKLQRQWTLYSSTDTLARAKSAQRAFPYSNETRVVRVSVVTEGR